MKGKIFLLKETSRINNHNSSNINLSTNQVYVQIKMTEFKQDDKTQVMFQFIDISNSIKYDKQKAENKLVGLINACLSHELRNPLNSIIAQNLEKAKLYAELEKLIEEQSDTEAKEKMEKILKQLKNGKKV